MNAALVSDCILQGCRSHVLVLAALALGMIAGMDRVSAAAPAETGPFPAHTKGRDELVIGPLRFPTGSPQPGVLRFPAGQIYATEGGERVATLRDAEATPDVHQPMEVSIPCVALSGREKLVGIQQARLTPDSEPRLAPLLKYLSTRNDVPRQTSECVALALLEDISFQKWAEISRGSGAGVSDASDVVMAIDAVGILQQIVPSQTFRLTSDPELKLRALRNPATRAKALQLYGMTIPGDTAAGQTPPDLGQLLHTKPGDNCPICRMRAQMQAPASGL